MAMDLIVEIEPELTEQEAAALEASQLAAGALPSPEFIKGYVASLPDAATPDPKIRLWLLQLLAEVETLRRVMAERPAAQIGPVGRQLSDTEMRVYRYLRNTLMTYAEIARVSYVSVNTIKTQAKAIYRKLGVSRRAELRAQPNL